MAQYHEEGIGRLIGDPRTMLGLSDGGAHVDMLCDAGYCTYLLGNWVRERQAMTLEHAVKRITSEPADFFGIRGAAGCGQGWPPTSRSSTTTPSARPSVRACNTICRAADGAW